METIKSYSALILALVLVILMAACDDSLGIEDNVSKFVSTKDTLDTALADTVFIRDTTFLHDTTFVHDTTIVNGDTTVKYDTIYIPYEKNTVIYIKNINYDFYEKYYHQGNHNPIAYFHWDNIIEKITGKVDTAQYYPTPFIYMDLRGTREGFNDSNMNKDNIVKSFVLNLDMKIPLSMTYYLDGSVNNGSWCTIKVKNKNGAETVFNAKDAYAVLQFMEWKTTNKGKIIGARLLFTSSIYGVFNDLSFYGYIDFEF